MAGPARERPWQRHPLRGLISLPGEIAQPLCSRVNRDRDWLNLSAQRMVTNRALAIKTMAFEKASKKWQKSQFARKPHSQLHQQTQHVCSSSKMARSR